MVARAFGDAAGKKKPICGMLSAMFGTGIVSRYLPWARCDVVQLEGRSRCCSSTFPRRPKPRTRAPYFSMGISTSSRRPAAGRKALAYGRPFPRRQVVRPGGDDGYAATAALEAVHAAGGAHARAILWLETGEESGCPDLPASPPPRDAAARPGPAASRPRDQPYNSLHTFGGTPPWATVSPRGGAGAS